MLTDFTTPIIQKEVKGILCPCLETVIKGKKYPSDFEQWLCHMTFEDCKSDECKFIGECWHGERQRSQEVDKEG